MRSGRIRKLLTSSSRWRTAPLPSRFGGTGFQARHVRLLQLQFGRVFDGDDALFRR